MTSRIRANLRREGDGSIKRGEQHGRALMDLILHDVILCRAIPRKRRVLMSFATAALTALLAGSRAKSMVCLSDLHWLSDNQLERVLAGIRYVRDSVERNESKKSARQR